jgi:hypothetical protein
MKLMMEGMNGGNDEDDDEEVELEIVKDLQLGIRLSYFEYCDQCLCQSLLIYGDFFYPCEISCI